MRIVEVVQGLGRGGAERALLQRLKYLPSEHESIILNLRPEIDDLPAPGNTMLKSSVPWFSQRSVLVRAIARTRPDIIVVRTPRDLLTAASLSHKQRKGARLVFEAHFERATEKRGALAKLLEFGVTRANKRFDLHLAVSVRVAEGPLCRRAKHVVIHYLGSDIDLSARSQLSIAAGTHFLFLGRFVEWKRPDWLIRRVANLREQFRESDSVLSMVGAGPLWSRSAKLIQELGIDDIVRIYGAVEEPGSVLRNADVLLIPSTMEGLPLTVFEAKQAGLRILTTPAGGTTELLSQHDRSTPDFDETSFEQALIDEIQRGSQSESNRRAIQQQARKFAAERSAARFYALLEAQA